MLFSHKIWYLGSYWATSGFLSSCLLFGDVSMFWLLFDFKYIITVSILLIFSDGDVLHRQQGDLWGFQTGVLIVIMMDLHHFSTTVCRNGNNRLSCGFFLYAATSKGPLHANAACDDDVVILVCPYWWCQLDKFPVQKSPLLVLYSKRRCPWTHGMPCSSGCIHVTAAEPHHMPNHVDQGHLHAVFLCKQIWAYNSQICFHTMTTVLCQTSMSLWWHVLSFNSASLSSYGQLFNCDLLS